MSGGGKLATGAMRLGDAEKRVATQGLANFKAFPSRRYARTLVNVKMAIGANRVGSARVKGRTHCSRAARSLRGC
jgi:hypothetical protein